MVHISLREASEHDTGTATEQDIMLSDKQRQKALKINIEHANNMARDLCAEGADSVTLTYYVDEKSFRAMKLPEEANDFDFRQLVTAETAKVMLAHGLRLEVQILDAKEYFEWLGARQNTYHAQHEYPGGRHVSGGEAMALLGIK
jgi:hypothetical protein